jgi:hypothetical protein
VSNPSTLAGSLSNLRINVQLASFLKPVNHGANTAQPLRTEVINQHCVAGHLGPMLVKLTQEGEIALKIESCKLSASACLEPDRETKQSRLYLGALGTVLQTRQTRLE